MTVKAILGEIETLAVEGRLRQLLDEGRCFICGKFKGQPPERCPGHYTGTDSDPAKPEPKP